MTATMVGGESCTHSRQRERGIRCTSRTWWVHWERAYLFSFYVSILANLSFILLDTCLFFVALTCAPRHIPSFF